MIHVALAALGRDRPGIVAEVTGVLVEHAANVEDSRMAILRGEFAMVLVVSVPEGTDLDALRLALEGARDRLGLEALTLTEIADGGAKRPAAGQATHLVSVYGADHPGIVHGVASTLAEHEVNITDLTTRLVDEPRGDALYAMALEVALPEAVDAEVLERALRAVAREQGVELSFRALEQDPL